MTIKRDGFRYSIGHMSRRRRLTLASIAKSRLAAMEALVEASNKMAMIQNG